MINKRNCLLMIIAFTTLVWTQWAFSKANDLDTLLKEVKQSGLLSDKKNKAREQRFKQQHHARKKLLAQVKEELALALQRSETLKKQLQNNDKKLADIDVNISQKGANLGELFGVVRQISGETYARFNNSIISIQYSQRGILLKQLSDSRSLPAITDLKQLWYEMQRQMTQSGKNVQFKQMIITAEGNEEERLVTRIGEFNSLSDGHYLQYLRKSNQLVELNQQPPQRFLNQITQLEIATNTSQKGEIALAIDPSGGTLLSLLSQMPDIQERIRQGGIIGYIILFIGTLSLLIALERYFYLATIGFKMTRQRKSNQPSMNNPLGRIMTVYHQFKAQHSIETLSLKLDEAILSETPKLERRLVMLGLFATVAPLLGLLGTVIGMIETFQSIALFGTGDPKLMSGGISQALVTTGLGLIVAVPAVLLHGFLQTKSNRLIQILDEESAGYIAQLAEQNDPQA
ncbi:MotA/TolQ/ExbB proton channel family protein [sulfur-oxidizing endosymbiont of Gigantopelta aegis]|uniref:MotA/TolQ/ExbB proton channel family protein n=1 Tax=sulfur-oxidizing endosymbiont of Gigantopelta aegis TaxID=2794934 RepID=UPI0018DC5C72|nr:MotA/TolQ/ExbB proton channel family protein [sulfur-oxidizing endosymbiont of Gigantopelta aegis]